MRLKIHQFLKTYGIKQPGELLRPRLHAIKKFDLPHESILHFQADNNAVYGPTQADPLFVNLQGKVFIEHVTDLTSKEGNPRRTSLIPASLIAEFRRQNRFFKPLRKDAAVKLNTQNVALFNYGMLNALWKYQTNFKANWFRWNNNTETFWRHVADVNTRFKWNQFIEIHLPESIPEYVAFNQLTRGPTQALLDKFKTAPLLNIFDIFRWLGDDDREQSFINLIPKEDYDKINFFIRVQGSFIVINLGLLDSWKKEKEIVEEQLVVSKENFVDDLGLESFFTPDILRRRFLSLLTTLVEYDQGNNTLVEIEKDQLGIKDLIEPKEVTVDDDDESDLHSEEDEEPIEVKDVDNIDDASIIDNKISTFLDLDHLEVVFSPPPESGLEKTTLLIEKDPMETPLLSEKVLNVPLAPLKNTVKESAYTTGDKLVDGVATKAFDYYQFNMISPRTFEQAVIDASSYKRMLDPFGSGKTVAEAMEYTEEDFLIPDGKLSKNETISNEALLGSIHKPMVRKYIKKLLPKDILQAVMSVQNLGIAVTDISVNRIQDEMNDSMAFTVTVKPTRGRSSQLRFRIPSIDNDGRFKANGVTYKQRWQRAD